MQWKRILLGLGATLIFADVTGIVSPEPPRSAFKASLDFGIGESRVDFTVQPFNNLHTRIFGRAEAEPAD